MLVFNRVYALYFVVVMNCYLFMRIYMIKLCDKVCCCYIISMMLLCPYFVFIDTSLSKHVGMFFDIGLSLENKRGLSLGELIRPFCIMFSYCYL